MCGAESDCLRATGRDAGSCNRPEAVSMAESARLALDDGERRAFSAVASALAL
jgi:hypothetical protein